MSKRKYIVLLCLIGFLFLSNSVTLNMINLSTHNLSQKNVIIKSSGYWVLDSIVIDDTGGGDYTWAEAHAENWCSGNGSLIDPFIIENITIDAKSTGNAISIRNSDVYFRIENCTFFNATNAGIELINANNSQIIRNNCSNNGIGISLDTSFNNEIFSNFINNNSQYGIFLDNAVNNLIFNNTIIWNNISAYDNGVNNDWDNGVIGNYWSDYDGLDINNDDIGDTPYSILGGSQDNFPLWDRYILPGINEYIPSEQIIKVGLLNDLNSTPGDYSWKGAYLAAKEINEAGGVLINGSIFYIGLQSGNTYEEEYDKTDDVNTTKGINAANYLISNYSPHVLIGGQNNFALYAYIEPIMDAKIPFVNTGVIGNLSLNVLNNYPRYKYYFELIYNGSELFRVLLTFETYLSSYLAGILGRPITKFATIQNPNYIQFNRLMDVMLPYLTSYGMEHVKQILIDENAALDDFASYWDEIDNAGAQLTFSLEQDLDNIKLISQTYGEVKPRSLFSSFNANNFVNTYWDDTLYGCEYEIAFPALFNVPRTSASIPFWNNFISFYGIEPNFYAGSYYHAIYLILNATLDSQSLSASKIVESLEKIDTSNPFNGVTGKLAFTSSHSLFHGQYLGSEGYGSSMMGQWQAGGIRRIIPNSNLIYPDSLATGSLQTPDWGINLRFKINSPTESVLFTEIPPNYNITILDTYDTFWYTINSGLEKYYGPYPFGTINIEAWNATNDGPVRLTFYCNDSSGHIFKRYVDILKDSAPPQVTIEPMETTTFGSEAPTITLNIQDTSNITASYYSLDGGVTLIPFTGNVVTINQTLWDELGEGKVTIGFYIYDSVGKETIVYVDVYKEVPGGMDDMLLYIIIGLVALALGVLSTIVYTQHRRKKRRKTEWVKLKKKKGLITPELAEGKNLIFISYATKDSDLFQIPLITDILVQYPEIDDILYWESDMHDDIYEYMDDNLKLCSIFLLFCTQTSFYSEPVKMEWRSALKLDKKIVPIFINPNDIPPLLTTKLGVQFNESEVYDSIEAIYQMILKKLEITSTREICRYLIPKRVSDEYFEEKTAPMVKKDIEIESDNSVEDLKVKFISILENNNFEFLKKSLGTEELKKPESQLITLRFFAEDKFERQEIGLTATIQKVEDYKSKIYLRVMGNKEWMVSEILNDLSNKLYPLKTVTELLREYSEKIENFIDQIDNLGDFLRKNLGAEIEKIEEFMHQYLSEQIDKEEFVKKGLQLLGKRFILMFIENMPRVSYEKKELKDESQ